MLCEEIVCIYSIKNVQNDKRYYGSTHNFNKRKRRHINQLKNNSHHNILLQRAWNKYGEDNFIFEILERCDVTKLFEREEYFILKDNPEYNIGSIGGGDNLSKNPKRAEIIQKTVQSRKDINSKLSKEELSKKYGKFMEKNGRWNGGITKREYVCTECNSKISRGAAYKTKKLCVSCCKTGDKNPFAGKHHNDKSKQTLSDKGKKRYANVSRKDLSYTGTYLIDDNGKKSIAYSLTSIGDIYQVSPAMVLYVIKLQKAPIRGKMKGVLIIKVNKDFTL